MGVMCCRAMRSSLAPPDGTSVGVWRDESEGDTAWWARVCADSIRAVTAVLNGIMARDTDRDDIMVSDG